MRQRRFCVFAAQQVFQKQNALILITAMDEEKQRYDRQIRVWGKEAQFRLVNARVLLCGMTNLNIEVSNIDINRSLYLVDILIQSYHIGC